MVLNYIKRIFGDFSSGLDSVDDHRQYTKALMLYDAAQTQLEKNRYSTFTQICKSYTSQIDRVNDPKLKKDLSSKLTELYSFRVITSEIGRAHV